jgi:hypothetical protein
MNVALLKRKGNQALRSRLSRFRPRVEALEARTVPSVFKPIGIAGVGSFAGSSAPSASLAGFNVNTNTIDQITNETSLAVNPTNTNNLIGSTNSYQITTAPNGAVLTETVISDAEVSFDGGQTWTVHQIPSLAYTGTGDPGVAFDATGTAYASFLGDFVSGPNAGLYPDVWTTVSNNGGKSWSKNPVVIAHNVTNADGSGIFNDKCYIAAWGNGNAIITYTNFNLGPGGSYISSPIMASVTHDGGHTWSTPVNISGPVNFDQGSVPVVAADGSIYVTFFGSDNITDTRDHERVVKVDPATGNPLGNPVTVGLIFDAANTVKPTANNNDLPINNFTIDQRQTLQESQFRVSLPQGNIAADPTNPLHLAVCWYDNRNGLPLHSVDPYRTTTNTDIIVSQSFDGGATWSAPAALAIPNDQFYPWAKYDASGDLQIGFFDRSYDTTTPSFVPGASPGNHLFGYTLASETSPGSLTFTTQQVSTALSDPTNNDAWFRRNFDPKGHFQNATAFLGDYSNIVILGNGNVGAFWTDFRDNATAQGRTTQHGEEAFFGDPSAGSSSRPVITAVTPSHTVGTVTNHGNSKNLDSFFAGMADGLNFIASSSNNKNDSHSTDATTEAEALYLLGLRLGWPDENLLN